MGYAKFAHNLRTGLIYWALSDGSSEYEKVFAVWKGCRRFAFMCILKWGFDFFYWVNTIQYTYKFL